MRTIEKLKAEYSSLMDQSKAFTKDYKTFKAEAMQVSITLYERAAGLALRFIRVSPKPEEKRKIQEGIEVAHLDVSPEGAYSLAISACFSLFFFGILLGIILYLFGLLEATGMIAIFIIVIGSLLLLKPLTLYPCYAATKWRLQASNQFVLCILYVVIYMRHTSNLEHAIRFAGEHIGNPLALDLRKVFWDVETRKFSTIKESLDNYLERWKDYNLEFIESFHLIESSLQEPNEQRRLELLEKSLDVILTGTHDRMMHYAQEVKNPITMLHMLGIILPILGLIILPLMGSFLGIKWYPIALVYNIILPIAVYLIGYNILEKRPLGYSQTRIMEESEEYKNAGMMPFKLGKTITYIEPKPIALFFILVALLIGLFPLIMHAVDPYSDIELMNGVKFLGYMQAETGQSIGPFGIGAMVLSLIIPFGIAASLSFYYNARTRKLISIRNETSKLENEFRGALFQIGNRLGSGIPAEIVFGDVAQNLKGTPTGKFLTLVNINIRKLGMSIKEAIFNRKLGAIIYYPSSLIESSMKVLVESAKKGPLIVSKALISISSYLEQIHKVNERLKDLLSEITSSMKAQISFLTPMIAGIVVGISSMITTMIGTLSESLKTAAIGAGEESAAITGGLGGITAVFPVDNLMPAFFLQIIVGLYVLEVTYVLTVLANGIENGVDKLNEEHELGKNLFRSAVLYVAVAFLSMLIFNLLALKVGQVAV
ncbi:hypothetical protein HZB88_01605 [archaeon]|nr:hypothetical protein [archaeon]